MGRGATCEIKVNMPKMYLVRPNAGFLQPGECAEVLIILLPLTELVQSGQHCILLNAIDVPGKKC